MARRLPHHLFRGHLLATRQDDVPDSTPFKDNDEILDGVYTLFRARTELAQCERGLFEESSQEARKKESFLHTLERTWRRRLSATPDTVSLAKLRLQARLTWIETEIVMALLLDSLGLWNTRITDVADILGVLSLSPAQSIRALRALTETGKLMKKGVLICDDLDEDLRGRNMTLSGEVTLSVLRRPSADSAAATIRTESDLQGLLARLTRVMQKKSDALNDVMRGFQGQQEFQKWHRKQEGILHTLGTALDTNPDWTLSRARKFLPSAPLDWMIALALMGKQLHHINPDDVLFTGGGLCRAISATPEQYGLRLERFLSRAPLIRGGYIQPCGGSDGRYSESANAVQGIEFELTAKALEILGLGQGKGHADKWDTALREPRIRLSNLALSQTTLESVSLALDHVRHSETLMKAWGLGKVFTYGAGATLLFYGPPGTGKTATAEAIAHELGKPLLAVDYSRIQNCFVGQTEKNIVKIFRKARQYEAVLFWDEADAMFFDRDAASHAWEVRDVNVLLQEIERFEGVCILATNRKTTLDKALERRISAKVEFPRPDRALRETLWRKLLPKQLPLAKDVDLSRLSVADLAGGEIKNVILNASRFACGRGEQPHVTASDFERALALETRENWGVKRKAGFK